MKKVRYAYLFILIICFSSVSAQQNMVRELYSLSDLYPVCIEQKDNRLYGVHWSNSQQSVQKYKLESGALKKSYTEGMPDDPIVLLLKHPHKELLYLLTASKKGDQGALFLDAVYQLNLGNNKLERLYKEPYDVPVPTRLAYSANCLVLITLKQPTRILNLKTHKIDLLCYNADYQYLSVAPKKDGFLFLNTRNSNGSEVSVHFMNRKFELGDSIGYANPTVSISRDFNRFQLPNVYLKEEYAWAVEDMRYNTFPLVGGQVNMRPYWLRLASTLPKADKISAILDGSPDYIVVRMASGIGVYTYDGELFAEKSLFEPADVERLNKVIQERNTLQRIMISDPVLGEVFNASFYRVTENKTDIIQEKATIMAYFHGVYIPVKAYTELFDYVKADFRLHDEASAVALQKCFDLLFPPRQTDQQYLKFSQEANVWTFRRGEAFGKIFGVQVLVNEAGAIQEMQYNTELK